MKQLEQGTELPLNNIRERDYYFLWFSYFFLVKQAIFFDFLSKFLSAKLTKNQKLRRTLKLSNIIDTLTLRVSCRKHFNLLFISYETYSVVQNHIIKLKKISSNGRYFNVWSISSSFQFCFYSNSIILKILGWHFDKIFYNFLNHFWISSSITFTFFNFL